MEDAIKNQRSIVFFLWKEGVASKEISSRLEKVFGEQSLRLSTVYRWVKEFNDGRGNLSDQSRSGRPLSSTGEDSIELVKSIVEEDRRATVREIAQETQLSIGSIHTILKEKLHMRKLAARWVPHLLTAQQKTARVEISQQLLTRLQTEGEDFWRRFVTMDETWVPYFNPETKNQSKMWCPKGEVNPVKAKAISSSLKVMISVFWDCDGIILIDYLQKGVTINADYYSNLLKNDLRKALKNKRRGKLSDGILFQHDHATPHTARVTKETLSSLKWEVLPHPPYSPDLAPSDFSLFSKLKDPLRGIHFKSLEEIQSAIESWSKDVDKQFYEQAIKSLKHKWEKCINCAGDYIEKLKD